VSILLKHLATGSPLAGLSVKPVKAAIVSEERLERWHRRNESLRFGDNLMFFCRAGQMRTTAEQWEGLISHLAALRTQEGVGLVVIDPLAPFLPGASENLASAIRTVLEPLEQLTAAGQAVLLVHHPRKGKSAPGQAARGSGALSAFVDVVLEMRLPAGNGPLGRRRRIQSWSRFEATPRRRIIELSEDGKSYSHIDLEPSSQVRSQTASIALRLLKNKPRGLTSDQLLKEWPAILKKPNRMTLWRVLDEAVRTGELVRVGTGYRNDPFCFYLPQFASK
jgi:hypothetical protein